MPEKKFSVSNAKNNWQPQETQKYKFLQIQSLAFFLKKAELEVGRSMQCATLEKKKPGPFDPSKIRKKNITTIRRGRRSLPIRTFEINKKIHPLGIDPDT